jgi:hypothetical protein
MQWYKAKVKRRDGDPCGMPILTGLTSVLLPLTTNATTVCLVDKKCYRQIFLLSSEASPGAGPQERKLWGNRYISVGFTSIMTAAVHYRVRIVNLNFCCPTFY